MDFIEAYLSTVITPLLAHPASLKMSHSKDEMGVLIVITVAPEDMGSVIGKSGETIKAVRHIIRMVGMKKEARCSIKVNEPAGSKRIREDAIKS